MLRAKQFTIYLATTVGLVAGLGMLVQVRADKSSTVSEASSKNQVREALSRFNPLIGGWRGAGQVKRGSTRGAWQETGKFVWKFEGDNVGIEYSVKKPRHIETGLLSWDSKEKQYTFNAKFKDGSKRNYAGNFERKTLTMESDADKDGYVSRVTLRQLSDKRTLLLYERRKATQSFYTRVGEVGYTREGTRLAASDNTGPVCVVTGGAGTIKVTHKGKTYYVCCTGCRDAFNDDPESILADYRAELEKKKAKTKTN